MIRSVASKVMWVGRATVFLVGLAVILALTVGAVSRATAHTGSAGLFHLGHSNPVTAVSTLAGNVAGGVLKVSNSSTATTATAVGAANKSTVSPAVKATNSGGGPALGLSVGSGKAPMTVNSNTKVANLNADRIDDREASSFADGVGGKATNADKLDDLDSADFQKRVGGECPAGQSIRSIGASGTTVACEPDDGVTAYARVWAGSTPSLDKTSGFASVTRMFTGNYCLEPQSGVNVRNSAVVVSVDWSGTQGPEGAAEAMFLGTCGTNGITIVTERLSVSNGVLTSSDVNNISFHVIVA